MKYSVCIEAVYRGQDFLEAIQKVKAEGYNSIEFWNWENKDLDAIAETCKQFGVSVCCFCATPISMVDPAKRDEYLQALAKSIEAAQKLGCSMLIAQVGQDTGAPREEQLASAREGLRQAVPLLQQAGITLLVEPLNVKVDHVGYFMPGSDEAFDLIKAVDSPYVKVLFDLYHQQISEGDLLAHLLPNLDYVGHVHSASVPHRQELYYGEVHYKYIVDTLKTTDYQGRFGLEYIPKDDPSKGLQWVLEWEQNS